MFFLQRVGAIERVSLSAIPKTSLTYPECINNQFLGWHCILQATGFTPNGQILSDTDLIVFFSHF